MFIIDRHRSTTHSTRGFSLVELSIILVILGLLVGGVLTGQSLIRASELRSVTTEMNNLKVTVNSFRGKYFALPGDMPNASSFWPTLPNRANDGDGDGVIHESSGTGASTNENHKAWQHVHLAGMIAGIDNRGGTGGDYATEPRSKFGSDNYWGLFWETIYSNNGGDPHKLETNVLSLGNGGGLYNPYRSISPRYGVMYAQDAYSIDAKMDDGKPDSGAVWTHRGYGQGGCVSADIWSLATITYSMTDTTNATCKILIKL